MSTESLLKKIKAARILRGFKQQDIAKKLNISIPTYSRFERGITKTDYTLVKKVCSLLELNFYNIESTPIDMLNESSITYQKLTETSNNDSLIISKQLKLVIQLLEQQQQTNAIILKNLKSLASAKN